MKPKQKTLLAKSFAAIELLERLPNRRKLQVIIVLFFVSLVIGGFISYGVQGWETQQFAQHIESVHAQEVESLNALLSDAPEIDYQLVVE